MKVKSVLRWLNSSREDQIQRAGLYGQNGKCENGQGKRRRAGQGRLTSLRDLGALLRAVEGSTVQCSSTVND